MPEETAVVGDGGPHDEREDGPQDRLVSVSSGVAAPPHLVQCMDCEGMLEMKLCHKYGCKYKCKSCHSSYRFCRDNVSNWSSLSRENHKAYILANRDKGGRGKKRQLVAAQAVSLQQF